MHVASLIFKDLHYARVCWDEDVASRSTSWQLLILTAASSTFRKCRYTQTNGEPPLRQATVASWAARRPAEGLLARVMSDQVHEGLQLV
jgi:hypothetical protein